MAKYQGKEVTVLEPAVVIKLEDSSVKTVSAKDVTFSKEELYKLVNVGKV